MRKIIFLSMSANKQPYTAEEEVVKKTWAKDIIDGKYEGCSFYAYSASSNKRSYVKENHIYIDASDSLEGTYDKTYKCFLFLLENYNFDYIVRTNTSTYINVQLVTDFINQLPETDDKIYCTRLISCVPKYEKNIGVFPCGLFYFFAQKVVKNAVHAYRKREKSSGVDDYCLFRDLKEYYNKQNNDFKKMLVCYDMLYPTSGLNYSFEKYNGIFSIRLKLDGKNRSMVIPYMEQLHHFVKQEEKKFTIPKHLSTQGINYDWHINSSREKNYRTPYKKTVLIRPITRALQLKRIKFRGLN